MRKLSVRSGCTSIISFSGPTAREWVNRICTQSSLWFCFCRRTQTQPSSTWVWIAAESATLAGSHGRAAAPHQAPEWVRSAAKS